jgi:hypothetical protein
MLAVAVVAVGSQPMPTITRLQNVRLKNLSFLAKSKIGILACFFRTNLTVLGVLVGSAGQ